MATANCQCGMNVPIVSLPGKHPKPINGDRLFALHATGRWWIKRNIKGEPVGKGFPFMQKKEWVNSVCNYSMLPVNREFPVKKGDI